MMIKRMIIIFFCTIFFVFSFFGIIHIFYPELEITQEYKIKMIAIIKKLSIEMLAENEIFYAESDLSFIKEDSVTRRTRKTKGEKIVESGTYKYKVSGSENIFTVKWNKFFDEDEIEIQAIYLLDKRTGKKVTLHSNDT